MQVLPAAHLVHFYSTPEGLAGSLCGFFAEPLKRGESVIVIALPEHRAALDASLRNAGVDLAAEIRAGRYVSLDVTETLDTYLVDDRPSRELFENLAPAMVLGARRRTGSVHLYGELSATLLRRGDVVGAMEFEGMWEELVHRTPFPVICGYPREALEGDLAAVVDGVTSVHDAFVQGRSTTHRAPSRVVDLALGPQTTGEARRHVRDVLATWGHEDADTLVDDAVVVVSELLATASRQGAGQVTLSLTLDAEQIVISLFSHLVKPTAPAEDDIAAAGWSLAVLAGLAQGWGTEQVGEGRTLWARLRRSRSA